MSFIRPEVRQALYRWRDALVGIGVVLLGLWWALRSFGVMAWLGWAVVVLGVALVVAGIQRGRFRGRADGPGVVTIDERRLVYYGPLSGGVLNLDDLTMLAYDPKTSAGPSWVLTAGGDTLWIPLGATGAEALFDAFAATPGLSMGPVLDVLSRTPAAHVVLWRRGAIALH